MDPTSPARNQRRSAAQRRTVGLALFLFLALFSACSIVRPEPVTSRLASKVSQLFLVGFRGTMVEGNAELRHLVCDLKVGGVVLFTVDWTVGPQASRNIASREQVSQLTDGLQRMAASCGTPPLLIAADNEGGQVQRLHPR